MPYRFETNGRYNVYDGQGNLIAKADDLGYVIDIIQNNQGAGYRYEDTQRKEQ
ncbi:hypothetical protein D3C84_1099600 [compost metagenome]